MCEDKTLTCYNRSQSASDIQEQQQNVIATATVKKAYDHCSESRNDGHTGIS